MGQRYFFPYMQEMKTDTQKNKTNNSHSQNISCSSVVRRSPGSVGGEPTLPQAGVAANPSPINHCHSHLNHA